MSKKDSAPTKAPENAFCCWSFIMYPESWSDGKQWLLDHNIPCVISPLHDKDTLEDGTLKKPHYHVVVKFSGPKKEKGVRTALGMVPEGPDPHCVMLVPVYDFGAMVRYLIHKGYPEKYQYDSSDIAATIKFRSCLKDEFEPLTLFDVLQIALKNDLHSIGHMTLFALKTKNVALGEFIRCNTYCLEKNLQGLYTVLFNHPDALDGAVNGIGDHAKATMNGFDEVE